MTYDAECARHQKYAADMISYSAAFQVITDLMIMALPLWVLSTLKMRLAQKLGLALIFCLATVTVVLELLRTVQSVYMLQHAVGVASPKYAQVTLYASIEICVNAMLPSIPVYQVLFEPNSTLRSWVRSWSSGGSGAHGSWFRNRKPSSSSSSPSRQRDLGGRSASPACLRQECCPRCGTSLDLEKGASLDVQNGDVGVAMTTNDCLVLPRKLVPMRDDGRPDILGPMGPVHRLSGFTMTEHLMPYLHKVNAPAEERRRSGGMLGKFKQVGDANLRGPWNVHWEKEPGEKEEETGWSAKTFVN